MKLAQHCKKAASALLGALMLAVLLFPFVQPVAAAAAEVEGSFTTAEDTSMGAAITENEPGRWTLENETMRAEVRFADGGITLDSLYNKAARKEMLTGQGERSLFDFSLRDEDPQAGEGGATEPWGLHTVDNGDAVGNPNSPLTMGGSWNTKSQNAGNLNYYMRGQAYSNSPDATIELDFTGSYIEYHGSLDDNNTRSCDIYIDDMETPVATGISQYDPTPQTAKFWDSSQMSTPLQPGRHKLKVVNTGSGYLRLDKFVFGDDPAQSLHKVSGTQGGGVKLSGSWNGNTSTTEGDSIEFTFSGTSVQWEGTRLWDTPGTAEVWIDGATVTDLNMRHIDYIDLAGGAENPTGILFDNFIDNPENPVLEAGEHTIKIVNKGGTITHSGFLYGPPPVFPEYRLEANDGGWTLGSPVIETISEYQGEYASNWGKRLKVPLTNEEHAFQVTLVFEMYDGLAGMRYYTFVKNQSDSTEKTITASDILRLDLPTGAHSLGHVPMQVQWAESPDGTLADGRRNALVVYNEGYGWSLNPENNWATSLVPGSYIGDVNHTFLKIDAFLPEAAAPLRLYTDTAAVQLTLFKGEEMEYFGTNLALFAGDELDGKMAVAEHFRKRFKYVDPTHRLSTNDWRWGGGNTINKYKSVRGYNEPLETDKGNMMSIVDRIEAAGFDSIHIDDFWNCGYSGGYAIPDKHSTTPVKNFIDYDNPPLQPGAPAVDGDESDIQALRDFALELKEERGLKFGLWYSPTGGPTGWGDGYNLGDPTQLAEKEADANYLIDHYLSTWIQVDQGIFWKAAADSEYDHEMDSVYRKVINVRDYLNRVTTKDPQVFMQTTCEVDNPANHHGVSLLHIANSGLAGLYQRTESRDNVIDMFSAFGVLPLEAMVTTYGEGDQVSWFAESEWYYQFLLARHTSIYSAPWQWKEDEIELMNTFNQWRKSPRVEAVINEIVRPVYSGENGTEGPYAWLMTDPGRTQALMLAVGGPNTETESFAAKPRWMDAGTDYLVTDISLLDTGANRGRFQNHFVGSYSGAELENQGIEVDLTSNGSRGKAYWLAKDNGLPIQVIYADNAIEDYQWNYNPTRKTLTVTMTGAPGAEGELVVYKAGKQDAEVRSIRLSATGRQTATFDADTVGGGKEAIEGGTELGWMDDVKAVYTGEWAAETDAEGCFDGTLHTGSTSGDSFEVKFKSGQVRWYGSKGAAGGTAEIWLDGVKMGLVDTRAAADETGVLLYQLNGLAPGEVHSLKVVVKSGAIASDFFDFSPPEGGTVDDADFKRILYSTTWGGHKGDGAGSDWGYHNNTHSYTDVAGASAEFAFVGDSFTVGLTRDSNRGDAEIYLDGELVHTLNARGNWRDGNVYYESGPIPNKPHRVSIVCKNGGQDNYISLDSIAYTHTPPAVEEEQVAGVATPDELTVPANTPWETVAQKLPGQLAITTDKGNTRFAKVSWEAGSYDGATPGRYQLQGSLELPAAITNPQGIKAEATVVVEDAAAAGKNLMLLAPLNTMEVLADTDLDRLYLPEKVGGLLEDMSLVSLDVTWDEDTLPPYNENQPGVYTFTGLATLPEEVRNDDSVDLGVQLQVQVLDPAAEAEKPMLQRLCGEWAEVKGEGLYTETSWNNLQTALEMARVVLGFHQAGPVAVRAALENLLHAIWALERLPGLEIRAGDQPATVLELDVNEVAELKTVFLVYGAALPADAEWGTGNAAVATVENGKVTATGKGSTTLTAGYSLGGQHFTAECTVKVGASVTGVRFEKDGVELESILVDGQNPTDMNSYLKLLPDAGASYQSTTWSSGTPAVATINEQGVLTPKTSGTTQVSVWVKTRQDTFTDTIQVTVAEGVDLGITLNKTSATGLVAGRTLQLSAKLPPKLKLRSMSWSVANQQPQQNPPALGPVASVDQKGKVSLLGPGTATVVLTAIDLAGRVDTVTCDISVVRQVTGVSINLNPGEESIRLDAIGATRRLAATLRPADATNQAVEWKSSNSRIVTVTRDTGLITAVKHGSATITAITADGRKSAKVTVKVVVPATGLSFKEDGQSAVNKGKTITLTPVWASPAPTNRDLEWTSSNPAAASVDNRGRVKGVAAGSATITATSRDNPSVSASRQITVQVPVTSLAINQADFAMNLAESQALSLTFNKGGEVTAQLAAVKWSCKPAGAVTFSDLTAQSPTITPAVSRDTTVTITAETTAKGQKVMKDSVKVSLTAKAVNGPARLAPKNQLTSLEVGRSFVPKLTIDAAKPCNKNLNWTLSPGAEAFVELNGSTGEVRATAPSGSAELTLTGTSVKDSGKTVAYTFKTVQPVTKVSLDKTRATVNVGENGVTLVATVYPQNASVGGVSWTSSKPAVATVADGVVTGLKPGTATITAAAKGNPRVKASCTITVQRQVEDVKILPPKDKNGNLINTIAKGQSIKLGLSFNGGKGSDKPKNTKVSWTSSNPAVATVNSHGTVKGLAGGTTDITACSQDGGCTDSFRLTVTVPVTRVVFNQKAFTMAPADTATLSVATAPGLAELTEGQGSFTWSLKSGSAVQLLSAQGGSTMEIKANALSGKKSVKAEVICTAKSGAKASLTVTVAPSVTRVTGVSLGKDRIDLLTGKSTRLAANVAPSRAGNKNVEWTLSNVKDHWGNLLPAERYSQVIRLEQDGTLTAVAPGSATLTATTADGGKTASCTVNCLAKG